jgi:hypothetical protein
MAYHPRYEGIHARQGCTFVDVVLATKTTTRQALIADQATDRILVRSTTGREVPFSVQFD